MQTLVKHFHLLIGNIGLISFSPSNTKFSDSREASNSRASPYLFKHYCKIYLQLY